MQKCAEKVAPREPCPVCISHHRVLGANLNLVSILKTGDSLIQNVIFLPCQNWERRPKELTSLRGFFSFFCLGSFLNTDRTVAGMDNFMSQCG